jgi:hypothetical protein
MDESGQRFEQSTSQVCVGSRELYLYARNFNQKKKESSPSTRHEETDWRSDSTHSYRLPHMKVYNREHSSPGETSRRYVSNLRLGGSQLWRREMC